MAEALMSQREVEHMMYQGGINRAESMMEKAEVKGRAITNPYAKEIIDEYVLPLAKAIRTGIDLRRAGKRQAHAALLGALDPEAVAGLAIRTCLNEVLAEPGKAHLRSVSHSIGRTIHNELVLEQIADAAPELYFTLSRDFNRRLSKDERHRMTVFKMQAKEAGIEIVEWPLGSRDQIGMYLIGLIEAMGMIEIESPMIVRQKVAPRIVNIHPDLMERILHIKAHIAITMPVFGPCVEPPLDWTNALDGGYHTPQMRRAHGTLVRHRLARTPYYTEAVMPTVMKAVNTLQRTKWAVNREVLDIILEVGKHFSAGEVQSMSADPKPMEPEWLSSTAATPRSEWKEWQQDDFKKWKRLMADWYTRKKLSAISFSRFYSATRSAMLFKDYPAIHFVYFADSRGRLYPMTYGLNPQGSDLQRGLLTFAQGLPLNTPDSCMWFCVQGANKWGFDKASLEGRQAWVMDREDLILSFASDPINNNSWKDAAYPIQFLAWCLEFSRWRMAPTTFISHLPVSMDGSCNGLQNLSALLRDEVGGRATNLIPSEQMQDIYKRVAEASIVRMQATALEDAVKESMRLRWLKHGINRDVVKRSVMTTPYGVTKRAAVDYVVDDYLKAGKCDLFDKTEWMAAAAVLMDAVWPAIGDVVVKGREAMDWLQSCSRAIIKKLPAGDDAVITWTSPSGFPACQAYYETEVHRINTKLHGGMKIRVMSEVDNPDASRHNNGMAPNFVHSMDAAHLHLTTAACSTRIDAVAMIHDDYGTHAANAQFLYDTIREQFVAMYEQHDPIAEFAAKYPGMSAPPERGGLDIREVLKSRYFFS